MGAREIEVALLIEVMVAQVAVMVYVPEGKVLVLMGWKGN